MPRGQPRKRLEAAQKRIRYGLAEYLHLQRLADQALRDLAILRAQLSDYCLQHTGHHWHRGRCTLCHHEKNLPEK